MVDRYSSEMTITLAALSEMVAGKFSGDGAKIIRGAAPFEAAGADDVTWAGDAIFLKKMDVCGAGVVIVPHDFKGTSVINLIFSKNPQAAFARALTFFYPPNKQKPGVHPQSHVGSNVVMGKDVAVAPFAVIQDNVTLGDRVSIHSNVVIGDNVVMGDDVILFPNVTILERCRIGNRVTIQAGTVIGSDGFGYAPDGRTYLKIRHTGIVQIDDDVEIGAGNTIDRATFGKTWIQRGVKTDNLVHIAHNVTVGEDTILVAQVGIAGSATIGKHVIVAGQAAISGHLEIGDDVIIGPRGGVSKSLPNGAVVSGGPEMPHRTWLKVQRIMPRLPELKKKIDELEKRLKELEKK
ncbi:MAG: UDP-3-O-(3-hydroxymyristoyl)glucosamine N-acyltransferase [Desulfobacterales bacterium]|nr:UDP-3-O-(3-hydroxymyristoyl)glucosamine N-acyltransferase [Desulfobacterales bacterium]